MLAATKLDRDKIMFVATKYFSRDKHLFVASSKLLSRQIFVAGDKICLIIIIKKQTNIQLPCAHQRHERSHINLNMIFYTHVEHLPKQFT